MLKPTPMLKAWFLAAVFFAVPAHATRPIQPLPPSCQQAEKSPNLAEKIEQYTHCLGAMDKDLYYGFDWNRRDVHFRRGNAYFDLNRYHEALVDYNVALQSGVNVWSYHQRGMTHEAIGNHQQALKDYQQALAINEDAFEVLHSRGSLYAKLGRYRLAIQDLRKAVRLSPETALYANDLAWLLATCPDKRIRNGKEAVSFARQALASQRSAFHLDTLAAALAAQGDFEQAIMTQRQAIDLWQKERGSEDTHAEFKARLQLYVARKAYIKAP